MGLFSPLAEFRGICPQSPQPLSGVSHPRTPGPFSCSPSPTMPVAWCLRPLFLTAGNPRVRKKLSANLQAWGVTEPCEVGQNPQSWPRSCRGPCLVRENGLPQACGLLRLLLSLALHPSVLSPNYKDLKREPLNPTWGLSTCLLFLAGPLANPKPL